MKRLRIAVLTPDARPDDPPERADTFVQAREVVEAIMDLGHEPIPAIWTDLSGAEALLREMRPDIVFNLVEDLPEGPTQLHKVTALCDELRLRHTGAPTAALLASSDKRRMKARLAAAGLPVPPAMTPGDETTRFIVKSATEHASHALGPEDVVVGSTAAEALIALKIAAHGGPWFAEAYVPGREINQSLLESARGLVALPAGEILFLDQEGDAPRVLGHDEKWAEDSEAYRRTPRVRLEDAPELAAEIEALSRAAWRAFGLKGYARVDFRVPEEGRPVILEVNANPCLSATAGFCASARDAGLSQTDVVGNILAAALV
ncbi:D-alanine--D-alanine ligase [Arsenicitalea aurantiaca]|uniref:D-alanine--D-alanine ligase n=1 Tax=Arsenicitalea aurantiaca TaxID=1783274 RepID=A0A433XK90_9HYPH|nr:D-alanine--D-alanine ligase [Arsenicitalea aurantiaca]RUT34434.1 D-alanine--D-alanine ligase [Arsenicitalea aurantiaca]